MKKIVPFILTMAILLTALSACAEDTEGVTIILQIGNSQMKVNGKAQELDCEPVIVNDRPVVPFRAVIEEWGGIVFGEQ